MLERRVLSSLTGIRFSMEERERVAAALTDWIEGEVSRALDRRLNAPRTEQAEGMVEPTAEQPSAEEPPAKAPAEEHVSQRVAAEQAAAEEPPAEQASVEQATVEAPSAEESIAAPASEEPSEEKPSSRRKGSSGPRKPPGTAKR